MIISFVFSSFQDNTALNCWCFISQKVTNLSCKLWTSTCPLSRPIYPSWMLGNWQPWLITWILRIVQFLTQQKLPSTGKFSKNLIIDIFYEKLKMIQNSTCILIYLGITNCLSFFSWNIQIAKPSQIKKDRKFF